MRYRQECKFGIIYGQVVFLRNINFSRTEAKEIIDAYKKIFRHTEIMDYTRIFADERIFRNAMGASAGLGYRFIDWT